MVKYTETKTYLGIVNQLFNSISSMKEERAAIKLIKRCNRTKEQSKRFVQIPFQLKAKETKLRKVQQLNIKLWDLVNILMDADSTLWSIEEQETWYKELAAHEGRGEKALRMRHGLPIISTQGDCDLPEINEEAKNIQGRQANGKFCVQSIQTGKSGRQAYSNWMGTSAERGLFKKENLCQTLTDEQADTLRTSLFIGELSSGSVFEELPSSAKLSLIDALLPSKVFNHYAAVNCTTRLGYLRVPRADFDVAFRIENITKCSPKYALRNEYVRSRLIKTLSFDDSTNVAT